MTLEQYKLAAAQLNDFVALSRAYRTYKPNTIVTIKSNFDLFTKGLERLQKALMEIRSN